MMLVFWLVFEAVLAMLIIILVARKMFGAGYRRGQEEGFVAGHKAGWIARHDESTDEERESWRQRASAEMRKRQERELAAYQAEMGSVGRGLELASPSDSDQKN